MFKTSKEKLVLMFAVLVTALATYHIPPTVRMLERWSSSVSDRKEEAANRAKIKAQRQKDAENICSTPLYKDMRVCVAFHNKLAKTDEVRECFLSEGDIDWVQMEDDGVIMPIFPIDRENDWCPVEKVALKNDILKGIKHINPPDDLKPISNKMNKSFISGMLFGGIDIMYEHIQGPGLTMDVRNEMEREVVNYFGDLLPAGEDADSASFTEGKGVAYGLFNTILALAQERDNKLLANYEPICKQAEAKDLEFMPNFCSQVF